MTLQAPIVMPKAAYLMGQVTTAVNSTLLSWVLFVFVVSCNVRFLPSPVYLNSSYQITQALEVG
jgi:hypothetical protein